MPGCSDHCVQASKEGGVIDVCLLSSSILRARPSAPALLATPAGAQGVLTHQKNVSLELARTIADAALAKCRTMGFKIAVSVVDRDGLPVLMMYEEGAGLRLRARADDRKAYTAAAFHAPSADFAKRMHDRPETAGSIQYTRACWRLVAACRSRSAMTPSAPLAFRELRAKTMSVRRPASTRSPIS